MARRLLHAAPRPATRRSRPRSPVGRGGGLAARRGGGVTRIRRVGETAPKGRVPLKVAVKGRPWRTMKRYGHEKQLRGRERSPMDNLDINETRIGTHARTHRITVSFTTHKETGLGSVPQSAREEKPRVSGAASAKRPRRAPLRRVAMPLSPRLRLRIGVETVAGPIRWLAAATHRYLHYATVAADAAKRRAWV